jgi:hypothetical protein
MKEDVSWFISLLIGKNHNSLGHIAYLWKDDLYEIRHLIRLLDS